MIFFRDQKITEEQHKAFGRRFGTLNIHPRYLPLEGHPEIFPIRKDPEHKENIGGVWHSDLTHLPAPPLGSILYALEVPPVGGDTMFASQYLAYEALSDGMKEMLDGMTAVHDNRIQSNKVASRAQRRAVQQAAPGQPGGRAGMRASGRHHASRTQAGRRCSSTSSGRIASPA